MWHLRHDSFTCDIHTNDTARRRDMTWISRETWLIDMWYLWHDAFMCYTRDMTHPYVSVIWMTLHGDETGNEWVAKHDSFICDIWDMTHLCVTVIWITIHEDETWHEWVAKHDSFICVSHMNGTTRRHTSVARTRYQVHDSLYVMFATWLIHMWHLWQDAFICDICDMIHLYVTRETWLIYMCQSYEWHYTKTP